VPCQALASATARLVRELNVQSEEVSHNAFDKRLAVAKELKIGRLVLKINGDRPVVAGRFGR